LSSWLINQALCHEDVCGSGGTAPPFLTLALDGGEWSASRPCRFTFFKIVHSVHWKESGWDSELVWTPWRREKSYPYRELNPGRPARRHTNWVSQLLAYNGMEEERGTKENRKAAEEDNN
jgi:hypothetical protein